jgi:conjugal transfer pilus assembly protein TraD
MSTFPLTEDITYIGEGKNMDDPTKIIQIGIPDSHRSGHIFVSGSTRSGKSRLAENIIEQDIRKGYNLIVIDPKVDQGLGNKIFQVATAYGRQNDLMYINTMFPEFSISINPLSHWFILEEIVAHCVAGIQEGKDPFYKNVGEDIVTMIVEAQNLLFQKKEGNEGEKPIYTFSAINKDATRKRLEKLSSDLRREVKLKEAGYDPDYDPCSLLADRIDGITSNGEEYFGKTSTSLSVTLRKLTSGNVGRIISGGTMNRVFERLDRNEGVILVCQLGSLVVNEAAQVLAKVILSMFMKYVGRIMGSECERLTVPMCLHLDEAQSVYFSDFEDAFAKVGSSNTWITSYVQDNAQVVAKMLADRAKAIAANNNTKIFLRSPDSESAESVTEHFGTHKVSSPIMTFQSITLREIDEPLIKPEQVMQLKPRDFFMTTYSSDTALKGRFQGTTHDARPLWLKLKYPKAPGC